MPSDIYRKLNRPVNTSGQRAGAASSGLGGWSDILTQFGQQAIGYKINQLSADRAAANQRLAQAQADAAAAAQAASARRDAQNAQMQQQYAAQSAQAASGSISPMLIMAAVVVAGGAFFFLKKGKR